MTRDHNVEFRGSHRFTTTVVADPETARLRGEIAILIHPL